LSTKQLSGRKVSEKQLLSRRSDISGGILPRFKCCTPRGSCREDRWVVSYLLKWYKKGQDTEDLQERVYGLLERRQKEWQLFWEEVPGVVWK